MTKRKYLPPVITDELELERCPACKCAGTLGKGGCVACGHLPNELHCCQRCKHTHADHVFDELDLSVPCKLCSCLQFVTTPAHVRPAGKLFSPAEADYIAGRASGRIK